MVQSVDVRRLEQRAENIDRSVGAWFWARFASMGFEA